MLEGKKKKDWLQTTRQTGMEMQMRNRNSKNQKSRRRANRTGVKKTHLVIIIRPEDTKKKGPNSSS